MGFSVRVCQYANLGLKVELSVTNGAENFSGLHTENLSWQTPVGKLKLACVNGIKTVGKQSKHVST